MADNPLKGENALVVGGGSGIGQAVAWALARAGCQAAVAGRRTEALASTCEDYEGPGKIVAHAVDVTNRESVGQLVAWFLDTVGPIDILVNAAGTNIPNRTMAEMRPEQWDEVLAINATGAYNCLAAVLPSMRERKAGTIIQISSVAGKRALSLGGVAYCASKFAMTALGTAVAQEEAEHGIRLTNICPGEVDTPLLARRPVPPNPEHLARILKPQDVAELVVSICALPPQAHVPEVVIKPLGQLYL
jgi:NAD(P)-dependent dehydrogenase (short-subunit alcohol dehydrogenase family)